MSANHDARIRDLQTRMAEAGLDLFMVQDPDSIYALSGYWGYLGMAFGRATPLVWALRMVKPADEIAITLPEAFGARVGDSVVVTENGFEYLTDLPRELTLL